MSPIQHSYAGLISFENQEEARKFSIEVQELVTNDDNEPEHIDVEDKENVVFLPQNYGVISATKTLFSDGFSRCHAVVIQLLNARNQPEEYALLHYPNCMIRYKDDSIFNLWQRIAQQSRNVFVIHSDENDFVPDLEMKNTKYTLIAVEAKTWSISVLPRQHRMEIYNLTHDKTIQIALKLE